MEVNIVPKLFSYCKQVFVYRQVKYSSKIMLPLGNDLLLTRGILFEKLFELWVWVGMCVCVCVCTYMCESAFFLMGLIYKCYLHSDALGSPIS